MRDLTVQETQQMVAGGTVEEFNQCMAENWWENTSVGAFGGATAGAFFGPGIFLGFVGGAMSGSTGTFAYCAFQAL